MEDENARNTRKGPARGHGRNSLKTGRSAGRAMGESTRGGNTLRRVRSFRTACPRTERRAAPRTDSARPVTTRRRRTRLGITTTGTTGPAAIRAINATKSRPHCVSMACNARPPGMNRHSPQGVRSAASNPATASPSRTAGCGSAWGGSAEGSHVFMTYKISCQLIRIKEKRSSEANKSSHTILLPEHPLQNTFPPPNAGDAEWPDHPMPGYRRLAALGLRKPSGSRRGSPLHTPTMLRLWAYWVIFFILTSLSLNLGSVRVGGGNSSGLRVSIGVAIGSCG